MISLIFIWHPCRIKMILLKWVHKIKAIVSKTFISLEQDLTLHCTIWYRSGNTSSTCTPFRSSRAASSSTCIRTRPSGASRTPPRLTTATTFWRPTPRTCSVCCPSSATPRSSSRSATTPPDPRPPTSTPGTSSQTALAKHSSQWQLITVSERMSKFYVTKQDIGCMADKQIALYM